MFGFIMIRHINSKETAQYWLNSYICLRKYYNNPILIIDDNSDEKFLNEQHINLIDCKIIKSEFIGGGEILPYYYFYKLKPFEKAIIIHDSVFINQYIDFSNSNIFLWHFDTHAYDDDNLALSIMSKLKNSEELIKFYLQKNMWVGCFGVMSIITLETINLINDKYDLLILVNIIKNRNDRMILERIMATIMFKELCLKKENVSIFGEIFKYCPWGVSFIEYIDGKYDHLPVVKVWKGR